MHKLIQRLAERAPQMDPNTPPMLLQQQLDPNAPPSSVAVDPSKLAFAHALYPFDPSSPLEISLGKGDIVAVLSTNDPVTGLDSEWWKGRTRDGREGWFPRTFVEVIQKKAAAITEPVKTVE